MNAISPTPVLVATAVLTLLCGVWPPAAPAADVVTPIDLRQVKVGGEIGRRIDATVRNNLLVLNAETDFLAPFRAKSARDGFVGLGNLIDAAVRFAAYTGNEKVIALKKRLVDETIAAQEPDGYIGMMAPPARMWSLWDAQEMGLIIFGLTGDYRYFGEKRSLAAAKKAADYIVGRWATMPADWARQTHVADQVALADLDRAMLTLAGQTGDGRYVDFCTRQRALPDWDLGIVIGRREGIEGHVFSYFSRCLAQLELDRLQPVEKLLGPTKRAMHFLTRQDGMSITGGVGQWEIFTADQDGRGALGETCATACQLRVYDSLLRLEGDPVYGDLMERTIYNALFGAQSPDGRQIRYFTPLEGNRKYWPTDTYCCPCNYRRIVADLPTMVYYRSGAGLAINLYTASEATVPLADGISLSVRQETDYPSSGRVVVRINPAKPAAFPLRLRIPRWCGKASMAVNGRRWEGPISPGAFLSIEREWTAGDRVVLDLPINWRLVLGRNRQAGRAAVMRGPVVFCLNPAQNESLRGQDAADLSAMVLDPGSLKVSPDGSVRPGGTACVLKAGRAGFDTTVSDDLPLRLTEFPDPQGKCVYFRLPDLSAAVPDELLSGGG